MVVDFYRYAPAALGCAAACVGTGANAQEITPAGAPCEIVVTAQNKMSTVQTTPVAITTIGGADIDGSRGSSRASLPFHGAGR